MLKKIQYLLFTIDFLVLYFKNMSDLESFKLTVNEENLSSFYLWKLKKTFLNHPGKEKIILNVVSKYRDKIVTLELKEIKIKTGIHLYLDLFEFM